MRNDKVQVTFSGDQNLNRFSFWKPEPLPPKDATILPIDLLSLGKIETVAAKLLDIPRITRVAPAPWDMESDEKLKLHWECDAGVWLTVAVEKGPPKPGEVLTIEAQNKTPEKTFFRLYVQLFEQFGVTVLDERQHAFLTPKEFKRRIAG